MHIKNLSTKRWKKVNFAGSILIRRWLHITHTMCLSSLTKFRGRISQTVVSHASLEYVIESEIEKENQRNTIVLKKIISREDLINVGI